MRLLAGFLCLLALAACRAPDADDTLVFALESDFPSLDPLRVSHISERQVALAIMDPLFDLGPDGELQPVLATGIEALDGGRRYRVHLRDGVRFHDGAPFDADAVVANLDRLRDPANACRCLPLLDNVETVRAVDARTVDFQMRTPDAALPAVLADAPGLMLSPASLDDDPGRHPVGAGPFRLVTWQQGHRIVVERNPDYWRPGLPKLERVEFRPLANEDSRQAALLAGDVHVMQSPHPRFAAQYAEHPRFTVMTAAGLGSYFLMMNTREPPFDDVRVRRAIARATDRPLFAGALFHDQYPVAESLLGPGSWAHAPVPDYPDFDPAEAQRLLDDYGQPVAFELSVLNSPFAVLSAQALQEMWAPLGIEVRIRPMEGARFLRDAINHQFQMAFFRFAGRPDPDLNLYRAFHSRYADRPSSNYTRFADPQMDALLARGRAAMDRDERAAVYRDISTLLAEKVPYLFLFHTTSQTLLSRRVDPGPNIADGVLRLHAAGIE